jgi:transposase-like protein
LAQQRRWQCAGCRHQVSLTAGTILHNTKTPLTVWFWAAYLMTTDKRGLSALLLQRQLAFRRYETAWMMLRKFRRAMVNLAREPLQGEVEIDDTWIGGTQAGLRGSRQLKVRKAALVLVAVEKRGSATGRARMAVIPDFKGATLLGFLKQNVAPGSTVYTDGLKSFTVDYGKLDSSTRLASNRCVAICAKAQSPLCLWPTARLATCSSG